MSNLIKKIINGLFLFLFPQTIQKVRKQRLSYLEPLALYDLHSCVKSIEKRRIEGLIIEAGCALGGSAVVIAKAKKKSRPFVIYDVFGMIPSPSENDFEDAKKRYKLISSGQASGINRDMYYGYEEDLLSKVKETFRNFYLDVDINNIQLIKGLFQETLKITEPVALAHIDSDWYDSVMFCLEGIGPWLVKGGVIIIDDYYEWKGCRKAVDEYFRSKRDKFAFVHKARLHIVRI